MGPTAPCDDEEEASSLVRWNPCEDDEDERPIPRPAGHTAATGGALAPATSDQPVPAKPPRRKLPPTIRLECPSAIGGFFALIGWTGVVTTLSLWSMKSGFLSPTRVPEAGAFMLPAIGLTLVGLLLQSRCSGCYLITTATATLDAIDECLGVVWRVRLATSRAVATVAVDGEFVTTRNGRACRYRLFLINRYGGKTALFEPVDDDPAPLNLKVAQLAEALDAESLPNPGERQLVIQQRSGQPPLVSLRPLDRDGFGFWLRVDGIVLLRAAGIVVAIFVVMWFLGSFD